MFHQELGARYGLDHQDRAVGLVARDEHHLPGLGRERQEIRELLVGREVVLHDAGTGLGTVQERIAVRREAGGRYAEEARHSAVRLRRILGDLLAVHRESVNMPVAEYLRARNLGESRAERELALTADEVLAHQDRAVGREIAM